MGPGPPGRNSGETPLPLMELSRRKDLKCTGKRWHQQSCRAAAFLCNPFYEVSFGTDIVKRKIVVSLHHLIVGRTSEISDYCAECILQRRYVRTSKACRSISISLQRTASSISFPARSHGAAFLVPFSCSLEEFLVARGL